MKGVSPQDTFEYVCKKDRDLPKEEQTVFVLAYLDLDQEADLDDKLGAVTDAGYQVNIGSTTLLALHYGLREVRNLDVKGAPVVLERDQAKKQLRGGVRPWKHAGLSKIPKSARTELSEVIRAGGELSEDERKN